MALISIWACGVVFSNVKPGWHLHSTPPSLYMQIFLKTISSPEVLLKSCTCWQTLLSSRHSALSSQVCHPHPHSCPFHMCSIHSQQWSSNLLNIHYCSPNTHQYLHKLCYLLKPGSLEAIHQSESIKQKGMFHLACRHNMQILGCWCKDGDRIFLLLVDIHLCPLNVK